MNIDSNFLRALDEQIKRHDDELGRLLSQLQVLEEKILQAREWLERAKALRDTESKRMAGVRSIPVPTAESRRFYAMGARDACHAVLRERKKMSKDDLADELKKGGYQFGTSSPLRVVHFALVNDPKVRMYAYGNVEWIHESAK